MPHPRSSPLAQTVHLTPGTQVVINGALVCAREACTLEISAGAYVLCGRAPWPAGDSVQNPCDELYFSLLDCSADEERFIAERFRLFALLGEIGAQDLSYDNQRECARCAAALMAGDAKGAVQCAARMAANGLDAKRTRTQWSAPREERRKAKAALDRR